MAQTVITGLRGTGSILSNKRVIEMSDVIAQLQPDAAPLSVILMKLRKKVTENPKFEWLEDDLQARWDAINYGSGYASGDTSLVVDNGGYFAIDDVVKVTRTGECLLVTGVSTNTLTVTRAFGETVAAAIVDNDPLVIIGNAHEEGSSDPTAKSIQESACYNYTQIFRTPFGVTRTENKSKMYGGNDLSYQRKKKGIEHRVDLERAFLFGERKELTTGTHYRRATRGVLKFLSTNVTNINGALAKADLDDVCKDIFQYGSTKKTMFCSGTVLQAISTIAGQVLQTVPTDKTFGIAIQKYISPFGELNLVHHRLLEGSASYDGHAIILDLANLWYRPLADSDTKLKTNIQDNDEDGERDEYLTEAGLQLELEKTHGYIYGVTGA